MRRGLLRWLGGRLDVMTGGDDAGPGARPGWRWDVALSFAGAQRDYVGQVAEVLKARGVRCFYDADEQVRLWGTHLAEELPLIYARESAAVVVFISADYAERDWTRLESRAAFSHAVSEAGVYVLPARFDDSELPALLSDVGDVDLRHYTPEQFADLVVAKLADLAISSSPILGRAGRRPSSGVRVSEADPRRLGVHAAISVPGVPDEVPPEYVPRDVDTVEHGVRAMVTAAARRGGFVLLVGGSSVGKTRCAAEAVKALLPDWWLVYPAGPVQVAALAQALAPQTVVWLDELERYVDGEDGLTGAVVRTLLNAPAVIIGTLWPDRYTAYTTVPEPGGADPRKRERQVLDLAVVIRIDPAFSPAEQGRARAATARDRRLQVALDTTDYGLTQTLAAAPQLVARWENAQTADPYAWAVLTAALDIARLGARAPLSPGLLRAAAPGYCTSQQQAEAPENWFEQALAYATSKLHGAVAALSPVGAGMGQLVGYTAADYLIQHVGRERRYARVPTSTWDAVLSHVRDPADAIRLADSASRRLLYSYAIPLYRHAVDADDKAAALRLAGLLEDRGDLDEATQILRARADAGDWDATERLIRLLADQDDLDEATQILLARIDADRRVARADADDGPARKLRPPTLAANRATRRLTRLLAERGDLDGLRALADADQWIAAELLADLLAERGDLDGLRARADAGDWVATGRLAGLLAERGDLDGLRARADGGDTAAAERLAGLLAERGDLDGLRARADAGDTAAAGRLARLLVERSDLDEAAQILRALADAGDWVAAERLAGLLAERGDLDGLRARADAGDTAAAGQLASLLAERGDLDGLRARADAGDTAAAGQLASLLVERSDLDEAAQILRALADAGDWVAAERLAGLLAERGDLDGLRARADAGDVTAFWKLARLLAERGDIDEAAQLLRAWADVGRLDGTAGERLADLLVERGDLNALRARADAGDVTAASRLGRLLAERGDLDEATQILRVSADAGDMAAAWRLADLLVERGDLDELRARADAGHRFAGSKLVDLLIKQGRGDEAERLQQFGLNPDGSIARS